MFDWLIVGAGFAGSILAERIATERDETVLIIDKRPHIAGNAYDHVNDSGLLVHAYGPHIFTQIRNAFSITCRASPLGVTMSTAFWPASMVRWSRSRSTSTPSTVSMVSTSTKQASKPFSRLAANS